MRRVTCQDGRQSGKQNESQIELQHQLRRLADMAAGRPVVKEADPGKRRVDSAAEAYYASLRTKEHEIKAIQQNLELLQEFGHSVSPAKTDAPN